MIWVWREQIIFEIFVGVGGFFFGGGANFLIFLDEIEIKENYFFKFFRQFFSCSDKNGIEKKKIILAGGIFFGRVAIFFEIFKSILFIFR